MRDFTLPDAQDILNELLTVLEHDEDFSKKFTLYTGYDTEIVENALIQLQMGNTK